MKCLKIEHSKGYFLDENNEYKEIDEISKSDILRLLNFAVSVDVEFEMDIMDESLIKNEAHKIIYRSLYQKYFEISENKNRFRDECNNLFRNAIEKYLND